MNNCAQYQLRNTNNSLLGQLKDSNTQNAFQSNTYIPMIFNPNQCCEYEEEQMTEPLPKERKIDNDHFELCNNNVKPVGNDCYTNNMFASFNDSEKSEDSFYIFDDELFSNDFNESIFQKADTAPNVNDCFENTVGQKLDILKEPQHINKSFSVSTQKSNDHGTDLIESVFAKPISSPPIKKKDSSDNKNLSSRGCIFHNIDNSANFNNAMKNTKFKFNPFKLGFEPQQYWAEACKDFTFADVVSIFFRARLSINTKFMYKLYNMLIFTTTFPDFRHIIGVYWITDEVFAVEKEQIALMLNLSPNSVNGSLFNKQGNFQTHGFEEVCPTSISGEEDLIRKTLKTNIEIYYYCHKDKAFRKGPMNSCDLHQIRYKNDAKKIYQPKRKISYLDQYLNCAYL